MLVRIHGKNDYFGFGQMPADPLGGLDAVHAGHADIHDDNIGLQFFCQINGFAPIGGLTDDFDIRLFLEKAGQTLSNYRMIIGHQNVD
jgi:hypothetical protein